MNQIAKLISWSFVLNDAPFLAGRSSVPDLYIKDIKKERALTAFPNGSKSPQKHVQDVGQDHAQSSETVPSSEPSVKYSVADTDDTRSVRDAIRENGKTLKLLAKMVERCTILGGSFKYYILCSFNANATTD